MNVIIQHNFTSGLGDFITDVCEYITFTKKLKRLGYKIHLKLSLFKNKYVNYPFINEILDDETLNFFDSIEETYDCIKTFTYQNYTYYTSSHKPDSPGLHHWDVFFDVIPDNIEEIEIIKYGSDNFFYSNLTPKFLPIIKQDILDLADSFSKKINGEYNFIHVRIFDENNDINKINNINNIIEQVKNLSDTQDIKLHVGSNNLKIINGVKDYKNIYTFDFDYFKHIDNDMISFIFNNSEFKYNTLTPILLKRLKYILAEMISIINAKTIIIKSDYNWVSNYLFYSLIYNNGEQKITKLNDYIHV